MCWIGYGIPQQGDDARAGLGIAGNIDFGAPEGFYKSQGVVQAQDLEVGFDLGGWFWMGQVRNGHDAAPLERFIGTAMTGERGRSPGPSPVSSDQSWEVREIKAVCGVLLMQPYMQQVKNADTHN